MDNITKDAMSVVFPKFLNNKFAKMNVEAFFDEFDTGLLKLFVDNIKGKVGLNEALIYQSETDKVKCFLDYDCYSNFLTMKIYYKDLPDIIEKKLSTVVQVVQKNTSEEVAYFPMPLRFKSTETVYGVQAEVVIEELGKELGKLKIYKRNGQVVSEINVTSYLKQQKYLVNEDDKFMILQSKICNGEADFRNVEFSNCGYIEQVIQEFDGCDEFINDQQYRKSIEKNFFAVVDEGQKKELFSEIVDFNTVNDGTYEIVKHTEVVLGQVGEEKYYVRGCGSFSQDKIRNSVSGLKLCEISKEKYYCIQNDADYLERFVETIQDSKEGRGL